MKQAVMSGLAAFFEANPPKLEGVGVCKLPGLQVPQMTPGDAERDAQSDYESIDHLEPEVIKSLAKVWIRRAASAKVFGEALETELEKFRNPS